MDIISINSFVDLPRQAADLLRIAEEKSYDFGLSWYKLFVKTTFESQDMVRIYVAKHFNADVQLVLPLRFREGCHQLDALTNFYSALYAPAVAQKDSTNVFAECFATIRQEKPAWSSLRLQPLDQDSDAYKQLLMALRQAGWIPFEFFCFGNWYLPIPESGYQEFIHRLPSRVRHTLERKTRLLSALGRLRLKIVYDGADLDTAIRDYEKVYAASWKRPEPYPAFIPRLIRLCAERGWLRLGLAHIDGEIAAAQLWIVHNRRAAIYKLAHDARFDRYSVGTLLTDHLMRHVMDVDHVQEIDYLIGDDSYKRDWMSHRRERWGLVAYNPRTLTGLRLATEQYVSNQAKRLRDHLRLLRASRDTD